jgi:cobalt-zinc-cadmium efflux system outer membrane protein
MRDQLLAGEGIAIRRRFAHRRVTVFAALFTLGWAITWPANAEELASLGATVETVLDAAHRLSPTLRAAALDSAAASARADRADALADPMLSVQTMQVPSHRAPMDQTTIADRAVAD